MLHLLTNFLVKSLIVFIERIHSTTSEPMESHEMMETHFVSNKHDVKESMSTFIKDQERTIIRSEE